MIAAIKMNSKVSLNPMLPSAHCPRRLCGYFPNYLSGRWSLSRWRTTFHPHNRQQASLAFLRVMLAVVHNWNPSTSEGWLLKLMPLRCFSSCCWLNSFFFCSRKIARRTKSWLLNVRFSISQAKLRAILLLQPVCIKIWILFLPHVVVFIICREISQVDDVQAQTKAETREIAEVSSYFSVYFLIYDGLMSLRTTINDSWSGSTLFSVISPRHINYR